MSDQQDNSIFHQLNAPAEAVLKYRAAAKEPAWPKHQPRNASKPQRFSRLARWQRTAGAVNDVVKVAIVAAGAASVAAPAVMHFIH